MLWGAMHLLAKNTCRSTGNRGQLADLVLVLIPSLMARSFQPCQVKLVLHMS